MKPTPAAESRQPVRLIATVRPDTEYMDEIATIGETIAVIAACWAIIAGVGAWKREFIGRRQIELAEQVLGKFFEVKDAIAFIRNPWSSSDAGKTRERSTAETETETKLLDRGYVVVERYQAKESVFSEFNTLKYRCMATFGAESERIFTDTNTVVSSIFVSARMLATHYWPRQGRVAMSAEEFQEHLDEMHRHQGVFWDAGANDDETRRRLQEIQSSLEALTASCFEEPMALYTVLTKRWRKAG